MLTRRISSCCRLISYNKRTLHTNKRCLAKFENPLKRTWRILKDDVVSIFKAPEPKPGPGQFLSSQFPHHVDVVVIGGGAIGSSIAYFLKEKTGMTGLTVAVIEKDLTYSKCSTTLSVGGLRQQFSLSENIQMSLYGAEFIRLLKKNFGDDAEVFFTPHGYLMLASESGAETLIANSQLQNQLGARNIILGKDCLKERFPWMNVQDVEVGCLGLENEGWFDPWAMLHILKRGAMQKGAQYVNGEAVGFTFANREDIVTDGVQKGSYEGLDELMVKLPNGDIKSIKFAYCVLAAGAESGQVAKLAKIGTGDGILKAGIPVERRKRFVYCFDCKENPPILNTPMTIDHTGAYFRRDSLGGTFLAGMSPLSEDEPDVTNLDVDYSYFEEKLWPIFAHRVPAFNNIKLRNAWAGYYDFNCYDENGIIGVHPYYFNFYIATGFSGHGIQQAPAVGRAIAEHIVDGDFTTIDLTRLGFNRLIVDKPMYEICIV